MRWYGEAVCGFHQHGQRGLLVWYTKLGVDCERKFVDSRRPLDGVGQNGFSFSAKHDFGMSTSGSVALTRIGRDLEGSWYLSARNSHGSKM